MEYMKKRLSNSLICFFLIFSIFFCSFTASFFIPKKVEAVGTVSGIAAMELLGYVAMAMGYSFRSRTDLSSTYQVFDSWFKTNPNVQNMQDYAEASGQYSQANNFKLFQKIQLSSFKKIIPYMQQFLTKYQSTHVVTSSKYLTPTGDFNLKSIINHYLLENPKYNYRFWDYQPDYSCSFVSIDSSPCLINDGGNEYTRMFMMCTLPADRSMKYMKWDSSSNQYLFSSAFNGSYSACATVEYFYCCEGAFWKRSSTPLPGTDVSSLKKNIISANICHFNKLKIVDDSTTDSDIIAQNNVGNAYVSDNSAKDYTSDEVSVGQYTQLLDSINSQLADTASADDVNAAIAAAIANWNPGTSAEVPDEDTSANWEVIEGGNNSYNDDNEDPKIYGGGTFLTASFLKPIMEHLQDGLHTVTKWFSSIKSVLVDIRTDIESFFSNWKNYLSSEFSAIGTSISNLPGNIATAFTDLFNGIKDVVINIRDKVSDIASNIASGIKVAVTNFPNTIADNLQDIADFFTDIFLLDQAKIKDCYNTNRKRFGMVLDFSVLSNTFNDGTLTFGNSSDPPVIKIATPLIIKSITHSDYIILVDFARYDSFCKIVRNLISGFLIFAYCYALLRKFHTSFSF